MAYYYCNGLENSNSFIGFRVARSFPQKKYKQKYFPLSKYSFDEAERLAKELSRQWDSEAEKIKKELREDRLNFVFDEKKAELENFIVTGLFCSLEYRPSRKITHTFEFAPSFCVTLPVGRKIFRITKHGYDTAFKKAVAYYAKMYDMFDYEIEQLLELKPCPSVFTGYLRNRLLLKHNEKNVPSIDDIDYAINRVEPQPAFRLKTGGAEKRITEGFYAAIVNGANWFYAPAFIVRKRDIEETFYIKSGKGSYDKAFKEALKCYTQYYRLSAQDEKIISNRKPSKETFINEILNDGFEKHGFTNQQYLSLIDTLQAS